MKYKHVFKIWLLADAFLATGLLCFGLYLLLTGGDKLQDAIAMFFMISLYGLLLSLPSLAALSVCYFLLQRFFVTPGHYTTSYITVIIIINVLYLLIGRLIFGMGGEFDIFYLGSTAAGLLSFYFVNAGIKKKAAILLQ